MNIVHSVNESQDVLSCRQFKIQLLLFSKYLVL